MEPKKCSNCKYRYVPTWDGLEACIDYARATTETEELETAYNCKHYEYGTPDCIKGQEEYRCPSSTGRDYSPSNPWDAPGMSIRDFI